MIEIHDIGQASGFQAGTTRVILGITYLTTTLTVNITEDVFEGEGIVVVLAGEGLEGASGTIGVAEMSLTDGTSATWFGAVTAMNRLALIKARQVTAADALASGTTLTFTYETSVPVGNPAVNQRAMLIRVLRVKSGYGEIKFLRKPDLGNAVTQEGDTMLYGGFSSTSKLNIEVVAWNVAGGDTWSHPHGTHPLYSGTAYQATATGRTYNIDYAGTGNTTQGPRDYAMFSGYHIGPPGMNFGMTVAPSFDIFKTPTPDRGGGTQLFAGNFEMCVSETLGYDFVRGKVSAIAVRDTAPSGIVCDRFENRKTAPGLITSPTQSGVVVDNNPISYQPRIAMHPDGNVWCLFNRLGPETYYRVSKDDGRTWGGANLITTGYELSVFEFDTGGTLVLVASYQRAAGKWDLRVGKYDASGAITWSAPQNIIPSGAKMEVACLQQSPDGKWHFFYKTNVPDWQIYTCPKLLSDGTGTWTHVETIPGGDWGKGLYAWGHAGIAKPHAVMTLLNSRPSADGNGFGFLTNNFWQIMATVNSDSTVSWALDGTWVTAEVANSAGRMRQHETGIWEIIYQPFGTDDAQTPTPLNILASSSLSSAFTH
jgi:hypothetical protein